MWRINHQCNNLIKLSVRKAHDGTKYLKRNCLVSKLIQQAEVLVALILTLQTGQRGAPQKAAINEFTQSAHVLCPNGAMALLTSTKSCADLWKGPTRLRPHFF